MVADKAFFFWTLAFPILFIVLFGLLFKAGDNAPPTAELTVVNLDQGRWGAYFIDKIKSPGIDAEDGRNGAGRIQPPDHPPARFFGEDRGPHATRRWPSRNGRTPRTKAAARVETRLYPGDRPGAQRAGPLRGGRPRRNFWTATRSSATWSRSRAGFRKTRSPSSPADSIIRSPARPSSSS